MGRRAMWEAIGAGVGGDGLKKLRISYETEADEAGNITDRDEFDVLFNPNQLVFRRKVTWGPRKPAAKDFMSTDTKLDFKGLTPETLDLTLFFDTYEGAAGNDAVSKFLRPTNPLTPVPKATDVRVHTERLAELAQISVKLHQPPRCELFWGRGRLFQGVLTRLKRQLTMFMPDGTPVRASVDCTFTQFNTAIEAVKRWELQSSDVAKRVVVKVTDSLPSIATAEYNDPGMWRVIARANGIVDPRAVAPGTVLILPPLAS